jgi:TrmH family RNA methyltransferase
MERRNMNRMISSLQNPLVKHLVKLRTDSDYRQESQTLLLEGLKPIQELNQKKNKIFYTPAYASAAADLLGEKWEITEVVLNKISGMTTPEGILAEISLPLFVSLDSFKTLLALDGINDPGNLGTILRTALALGWEGVYFLPNCCDPFNEKALRAGRGAQFKLKLLKGSAQELKDWVEKRKVQALAADISGDSPEMMPTASSRLLILGNEAQGVSHDILDFALPVSIPMPGEMESLNVSVAGGILLYLLKRSQ